MTSDGPFAGLCVVELGQFVAVPACAQYLADGGARVIKVEPVAGDPYRSISNCLVPGESRHFLTTNRGKQSVAIDFQQPAGRTLLEQLVARADVVLTNLSPGALERHRLRWEDVAPLNPRLIYGVVAAWGFRGQAAGRPGMDAVAQAATGLMWALGSFDAAGIPRHSEVPVADYAASMLLLSGVASALLARERDPARRGQKVEVSLVGAALSLQNSWFSDVRRFDGWRTAFVQHDLDELRRRGAHPDEIERVRAERRPDPLVRSGYRVFRTKDGYLSIGAASPPARARLLHALGLEELVDQADTPESTARVEAAVRGFATDELLEVLEPAGVPVSPVRHPEELVLDEQLVDEGIVAEFDHDVLGPYRAIVTPIGLSRTPFAPDGPAPTFGSSTRRVLRELGRTDEEIDVLIRDGVVAEQLPGSAT
jgi:crotonobetainyl-CoA:carnitine CoA-transferase CaiB-like acyl-CoA transferase